MKDRFKLIRNHFSLSQVQFAQSISKSPGFISLVETGKSGVSEETIKTICSIYGVNESWLRNGSGPMFSPGEEIGKADKSSAGPRVKQIRKRENLTQDQFAERIGFSKIHIHNVEAGKVIPSNEFLKKVSEAFSVSYSWLLTGEGEVEQPKRDILDSGLISWINDHPEVVQELRAWMERE